VPGEQEARQDAAPPLRLCLLREGDRARALASLPGVPALAAGAEFTLGPRDPETGAWTVRCADGSRTVVSHDDADELPVQRLP
jgi:hypothetical protein